MFCFDDRTFGVLSRYMFRCTEVCFGDNSGYTCMFLAKYKEAGQVQVDQENGERKPLLTSSAHLYNDWLYYDCIRVSLISLSVIHLVHVSHLDSVKGSTKCNYRECCREGSLFSYECHYLLRDTNKECYYLWLKSTRMKYLITNLGHFNLSCVLSWLLWYGVDIILYIYYKF